MQKDSNIQTRQPLSPSFPTSFLPRPPKMPPPRAPWATPPSASSTPSGNTTLPLPCLGGRGGGSSPRLTRTRRSQNRGRPRPSWLVLGKSARLRGVAQLIARESQNRALPGVGSPFSSLCFPPSAHCIGLTPYPSTHRRASAASPPTLHTPRTPPPLMPTRSLAPHPKLGGMPLFIRPRPRKGRTRPRLRPLRPPALLRLPR